MRHRRATRLSSVPIPCTVPYDMMPMEAPAEMTAERQGAVAQASEDTGFHADGISCRSVFVGTPIGRRRLAWVARHGGGGQEMVATFGSCLRCGVSALGTRRVRGGAI